MALSMTARNTQRKMVKGLIQDFHLDQSLVLVFSQDRQAFVLGFSQDRASVNTLAMERLDAIYFQTEDCPCFPHTLDHVGDKFVRVHLDEF